MHTITICRGGSTEQPPSWWFQDTQHNESVFPDPVDAHLNKKLHASLPDTSYYAAMIVVPYEIKQWALDRLGTLPELPAGFKLANADDRKGPKPCSTLCWKPGMPDWSPTDTTSWSPDEVYAIPVELSEAERTVILPNGMSMVLSPKDFRMLRAQEVNRPV